MAKGLVTSITANQARSYDRLNRNGKSRKAVAKSKRTGAGDEPGLGGRTMTTRKTTRKKARKARRTPAQKAATRKMIAAAKRARASKKRSLKSNPRKRKAAKKAHRRTTRKTTRRTTRKLHSNKKRTTRRKPARKAHRKTTRRTHRKTHRKVSRKLRTNKRSTARRSGARKSHRKTTRKTTRKASGRKGGKRRHVGPVFLSRFGMMHNPVSKKVAAAYTASTKAGHSYVIKPKRKSRKAAAEHVAATGPEMISVPPWGTPPTAAERAAHLAELDRRHAEKQKVTVAEAYKSLAKSSRQYAAGVASSAAEKAKQASMAAAADAGVPGATPAAKAAAKKALAEAEKAAKAAERAAAAVSDDEVRKAAAVAKVAEKHAKADAAKVKSEKWKRLMPRRVAARVGFKYGKHKSLVATVGKRKFPTYVYETKKKTLRHFSPAQLVGARPGDKRPEVVAAIEKLKAHRAKAARTSPFIPNKHGKAHVISFAQWKKMKANSVHTKGKGKYNRRRHQIAQSLYNELKRHGAKHEKRLRTSALAYVSSYVSHGPKKHNNIKRGTAVKDVKEVQSFLGIRRFPSFGNINKAFKFKRNPGMATFVSTVKAAAPLTGGFAAALVLTKFASDALHDALAKNESTSKVAPYAGLISSVLVPAVGAAATTRVNALPSKDQVAAGMIAAGILGVVKNGLALAGQGKAAGYLSGLGGNVNYTNAEGSNLPGYLQGVGSYYATSGLGSYFTTVPPGKPVSGFGEFMQPAAGIGALGAGDVITQAAAGMGEYFAPKGVAGLGQYETKPTFTQAAAGLGVTKEGIMPNTQSAERALQFAEAAAGLGDLPLVSTDEPVDTYVPVDDAPEGSRAGVFTGGDGIFG